MLDKINETADFLSKIIEATPLIGMITGTGLTDLAQVMAIDQVISYEDIPHFPKSTVPGHAGLLLSGHVGGKSMLAMQGRFHIYEGYTVNEVTFPIRVMALLGVRNLFISSAETRFLRLIGADAVGMSTVNEVIEAVHSSMRVLVIVAITNRNIPDCMAPISIEEVLANAKKASPALTRLLATIIEDLEA